MLALSKMAFGNKLGVAVDANAVTKEELFAPGFGNLVLEVKDVAKFEEIVGKSEIADSVKKIAEVTEKAAFTYGDVEISMDRSTGCMDRHSWKKYSRPEQRKIKRK